MLTRIGHELSVGHDVLGREFIPFLFDDVFNERPSMKREPSWKVDDAAATLSIEIPGIKPNDIDVSFTDRRLTISYPTRGGTRTSTYDVSGDYDIAQTSARVELGILELRIPRIERKSTKVQVEVR